MEQLAIQALLLGIDLYRNHYKKAKDWVPAAEEIEALRSQNREMTAEKYEKEAAERLGLPVPPSPLTESP